MNFDQRYNVSKADPPQNLELEKKIGAGDEIRTHDINLGKVALYP
jgi:hypothetical protein